MVEVSRTSLQHDRDYKSGLYARSGFDIYWILDLIHDRVEVHSDPGESAEGTVFSSKRAYAMGETVPLIVEGRAVAQVPVQDLLARKPQSDGGSSQL